MHRADKLVISFAQLVCFTSSWPLPVCTETPQKLFWDGPVRLWPAHGMCAIFFPWCLAQQHFINIWFCSEGRELFCFLTLKYKLSWPHLRFNEGDGEGRLPPAQLAAVFCGDGTMGGAGGAGMASLPILVFPCRLLLIRWHSMSHIVCVFVFISSFYWVVVKSLWAELVPPWELGMF